MRYTQHFISYLTQIDHAKIAEHFSKRIRDVCSDLKLQIQKELEQVTEMKKNQQPVEESAFDDDVEMNPMMEEAKRESPSRNRFLSIVSEPAD